ncbi:MAG: cytochrome P450 [Proteobacteria bacterium]|nr:cytochrome P450 [Pseudomonadota bacterium]
MTQATHPQNPDVQLLDGDFYARGPHPTFDWMRAHAPVYWDAAGQVWGVTRHADVMRVSKDPETFCSRFGSRPDSPQIPSMINLDDPQHRRRRNLVNRGFTPRRVEDHAIQIREVCVDLVERARERGSFDFVREVAAPLPMIMIGDMLGVAPEDRDDLLRWSDDMVRGTSITAPPEVMEAAGRAFAEYTAYNRGVVADRRARPLQEDLISVLVHAEIDGERLDDEELLQESLLILVGGDETTRHVITGGMHQLLLHSDQHQKLLDDPSLVPGAVEEMLRWVSPIQNMCRTATRDAELGGETIREGQKLLLLYPSANRDEAVFDDPHRFEIARRPNDHVAFGGYGAHFCLGASLARLELRILFEELLRRMPRLELITDAPLPMRSSNFITGIEEMPVRVAE